ncbi:MAG: aldehyde ferredoxin oxidoreductase family protein [Planctomycetes bacterium]|nr:aldehyde ferredoxin oxidoreductase family protein [Planctomycetota bacterium]
MSETPFGYHGRYLRVDLTTRKTESISIPSGVLRRFIGGTGLGTWLLLEETNGSPDALAAESPLIFVFSPLVGSPLTTSAKFAVLAKSPLTERINDSLSSSSFAIAGKKTGYDAFVITGAADSPTCLVIESETIRFEDAGDVWGKMIPQTANHIHKQLGSGYQLAAIGPAGENLVRFATISHDGRHAGRGGLGAVMGSKNLKAVAVRGNRLTKFAHPKQLYTYSKQLSKKSFGPATAKYRELGTVSNLLVFNRLGTLPTRNFQSGTFEHATALSPEVMGESHTRTRASCAACTIGCEHIFQLSPSSDSGTAESGVRMEYESLFALGSLCGVGEAEIVLQASKFCDEWGMDTISSGATIAFAMECAERGLIDAPELRFGNGQAMLETLKAIGSRSGLGELLSLGSRAAAREIGQGSEAFAPHVKGLEIPGYEPRAMQTMALGFAVGTRGADHNRSGAYQVDFSDAVDRMHVGPEAVPFAIETEDEAAVMDSLILCKFLRGVFDDKLAGMAEMLHLVTGWETTSEELRNTAQRIVTAKKWYNIQQGWTPCEDTLPSRFLSEPLTDGANAEATLTKDTLQSLIETYNLSRGWSSDGWVNEQQIAELGLGRG